MKKFNKEELVSIMQNHLDELQNSNDRRRRSEGRKLEGFTAFIEGLDFASIEANIASGKNSQRLNLGDVAEAVVKVYLNGSQKVNKSKAIGFDTYYNNKAVEIKSGFVSPSSKLVKQRDVVAVNFNGIYFIPAERLDYYIGKKLSHTEIDILGGQPLVEF